MRRFVASFDETGLLQIRERIFQFRRPELLQIFAADEPHKTLDPGDVSRLGAQRVMHQHRLQTLPCRNFCCQENVQRSSVNPDDASHVLWALLLIDLLDSQQDLVKRAAQPPELWIFDLYPKVVASTPLRALLNFDKFDFQF